MASPASATLVWGFPLRLKGMKLDSKPGPANNIAPIWQLAFINGVG